MSATVSGIIAVAVLVAIVCLLAACIPAGKKESTSGFVPARYIATQTGFKHLGGNYIRPTLNPRQYR